MTVYVDDMRAPFGRLIMCHMVADTADELHEMAFAIGVARRHYQGDHYDICLTMRARAVAIGAVEITRRQLGAMVLNRRHRADGTLGDPATAVADMRARLQAATPAARLAEAIAVARTIEPTAEQREAQRRSFAYGNVAIENPLVTRAMIDEIADRSDGKGGA